MAAAHCDVAVGLAGVGRASSSGPWAWSSRPSATPSSRRTSATPTAARSWTAACGAGPGTPTTSATPCCGGASGWPAVRRRAGCPALVTCVAPLAMTHFLRNVTGAKLLEKTMCTARAGTSTPPASPSSSPARPAASRIVPSAIVRDVRMWSGSRRPANRHGLSRSPVRLAWGDWPGWTGWRRRSRPCRGRSSCREASGGSAAYDGPLPIGHGQTNSPAAHRRGDAAAARREAGQKVLDVGSGSGWTTALLAHLTGPTGRVLGVELEPDLVELGTRHLDAPARSPGRASTQATPGVLGLPGAAPYHRILVSAMAERAARGARRAAPHRRGDGDPGRRHDAARRRARCAASQVTRHGSYRFVPLR